MQNMMTISAETVHLIQEVLFGCEKCSSLAAVPFEQVLDNLTRQNGEAMPCILMAPARCPSCRAIVSGQTLVEIA
jgi:hypothetical protein